MSSQKIKLTGVKGMNDLLPKDSGRWQQLEKLIQDCLHSYGYQNIRTPILEHTPVFTRGIGDFTDIVEKEMYSFSDALNGEPLTLRPEFTAGIVRATLEHNLIYDRPHRVYSIGPVFRHERPQRGRYRQFHQIDVEALGFSGPDIDAELIALTARLWRILGLKDVHLELNSLGLAHERQAHRTALIAYLEQHEAILDEDSKRRLYTNPLRVLDSKNPALQEMANNAPKLYDFLGEESRAHFSGVTKRLDALGIQYRLNPRLVRGLDYYNLTVFEWVTNSLGAQGTICGGGRYDGLFELLGGKPSAAVGFGIGMERLLELWQQEDQSESSAECDVYVVYQGDDEALEAFVLAEELRHAGLDVVLHSGSSSFKSQLKRADNSGALFAVIIGSDELAGNYASVKTLRSGLGALDNQQRQIGLAELATTLVNDLVGLNEI